MRYHNAIIACVAILSVSLSAENVSDQNATVINIKIPQVSTPVEVTAKVPKPLKATTNISKVKVLIEHPVQATTNIVKASTAAVVVETSIKKETFTETNRSNK